MPTFPPISVRQPRIWDIVDDPIKVCGIGTGFENQFEARVRDGDGNELATEVIEGGGDGI